MKIPEDINKPEAVLEVKNVDSQEDCLGLDTLYKVDNPEPELESYVYKYLSHGFVFVVRASPYFYDNDANLEVSLKTEEYGFADMQGQMNLRLYGKNLKKILNSILTIDESVKAFYFQHSDDLEIVDKLRKYLSDKYDKKMLESQPPFVLVGMYKNELSQTEVAVDSDPELLEFINMRSSLEFVKRLEVEERRFKIFLKIINIVYKNEIESGQVIVEDVGTSFILRFVKKPNVS